MVQTFTGREKAHPLNSGITSRTGIGWGQKTGRLLHEGDRVACISQEPGELMTEARGFSPISSRIDQDAHRRRIMHGQQAGRAASNGR
ncbi:MAG: hypothetical protein ACO262_05700, partial [Vulcanococcus sp.]